MAISGSEATYFGTKPFDWQKVHLLCWRGKYLSFGSMARAVNPS